MKTLYIIGNGFDLKHCLKTKYSHFKEWLIREYPEYSVDFDGLLECKMGKDGGWVFDENDLVGAIISVIDCIDASYVDKENPVEWNTLEKYVGVEYAHMIFDHHSFFLDDVDCNNTDDSNDKERIRATYNNEDISNDLRIAYTQLKNIFELWVREYLANLSFDNITKIETPNFGDSVFLNFNYTHTLEEVYGIDRKNICYIHGCARDYSTEIFFGHGREDEGVGISENYLGVQYSFQLLANDMEKDTKKVLGNNIDFFRKLKTVEEIYSYGFSFSDVDMEYITVIGRLVDLGKVVWYLNKYDAENNPDYKDRIAELGFKVEETNIW